MARDVILATVDLLKADAGVNSEVLDRVYGGELPPGQTEGQPQRAVVLRRTPGSPGLNGYLELESGNIDVISFGESPMGADSVRRAVHEALKQARRQVVGNTLLHSYEIVGGAQSLRDAETQWPLQLETWRFLASEVATS